MKTVGEETLVNCLMLAQEVKIELFLDALKQTTLCLVEVLVLHNAKTVKYF